VLTYPPPPPLSQYYSNTRRNRAGRRVRRELRAKGRNLHPNPSVPIQDTTDPQWKGTPLASTQADFEIRRADDRGTTEIGWLHSRHSFSFGRYYDPTRISYRALRVINDDIIAPGGGFGEHGHDHMEIISWMLDGQLTHADSTGPRRTIKPGDVQVMSAGRGIRHSEMNASTTRPAHLIQIWIEPATRDVDPAYDQKNFPAEHRCNDWQLIANSDASPDTIHGSMPIHQDAAVRVADLDEDKTLELVLNEGRFGYLHVAYGSIRIGEAELKAGDAATFEGPVRYEVEADENSELLFFDLA